MRFRRQKRTCQWHLRKNVSLLPVNGQDDDGDEDDSEADEDSDQEVHVQVERDDSLNELGVAA